MPTSLTKTMGTVFILGAGPRVGLSVARVFKQNGYKVAIGSRNPDLSKAKEEGIYAVKVNLGETSAIEKAFADVRGTIGTSSIVVYNAAAFSFDADDAFAVSNETFVRDLQINAIAAYAALRETVAGFHTLEASSQKAFIATGNVLPFQAVKVGTTLGTGKAALAYLIEVGTLAYAEKGYRFYFASQVTASGGPVPYDQVSGEAHGKVYVRLAQETEQGPWDVRFLADGTVV